MISLHKQWYFSVFKLQIGEIHKTGGGGGGGGGWVGGVIWQKV
jgi:hypothetical protein